MYVELLKERYFQERNKLEAMWVYQQEEKLKFIRSRRDIVNKAEGRLTVPELLGREDITEEVKDSLLRDRDKEEKVRERLNTIISDELTEIDKEEEEELRRTNYSTAEFADYLFQLEKVSAIEGELENNRLFPQDVYCEQKEMKEGK